MMQINCPSSSPPPSPSSCHRPFSCSSFQGTAEIESRQPPMDHMLNMSPTSYNFIPAVNFEKASHDQSPVTWETTKAPSLSPINSIVSDGIPSTKSSAELMKEIASLEVEIMHLEGYLLTLYRTAFEQCFPDLSESHKTNLQDKLRSPLQTTADQFCHKEKTGMWKGGTPRHNQTYPARVLVGSDNQSHATTTKSSGRVCKNADNAHQSLAHHLGASLIDNAPKSPDSLSEDIVRCISSIYCKLASPSTNHTGFSFSSSSSLSSSTTFSPRNFSDNWSPHYNDEAMGHCQFQGLKQESGPYAAMVEVLKIHLDDDSFNYAAQMLQNFRSLVKSLEEVNPREMKREEKLAFWINIHNALVMHAHLAYGTNYVRSSSVLKAAYNIGGLCINACIVQSSILGIRPHYSAPWLQSLLSPGKKLKVGSTKHAYSIEYPEPLVHFALCSGADSDPVVRVFTAKSVFQDLRRAKEEFIQANVYIHKETKLYLPKILGYFAKDMSLTMSDLLEIVNGCLAEGQQNIIRKCLKGRPDKHIYWLPQTSTFRYVIHREVTERRLSI